MVKLLCDPVYSLRDTNRCIGNYSTDEVARHVLSTNPDAFVYYVEPVLAVGARNKILPFIFDKDLERDFPGRVKYFPGIHYPGNRVYQLAWHPEWFSDLMAQTGYAWDWDVLLTMRGPGMELVRWLNFQKMSAMKKIVIQDHFPLLNFKEGAKIYYEGRRDHQLSVLSSYALADYVVVGADYEVREIMKTARNFLSPSLCKRLQKKLSCGFSIPRGLDLSYPLARPVKSAEDKVVGIFTQRLGLSGRHPGEVLDSFFYPFVSRDRKKVEFQVSTNSMMDIPAELVKKYGFVKFFKSNREEFYSRLRESDFCVSFSTTEGLPTSILEAICWGCIPVLVRLPWSEDMAGKSYPFLFSSEEEAVSLVSSILDDLPKAFCIYRKWYQDYFLKFLDRCGSLSRVVDLAIKENEVETADICASKEDNPIYDQIIDFVARKGIERFELFDLLEMMFQDKEVRHSPFDKMVGRVPQSYAGHTIPVRLPRYYGVYKTLLRRSSWKQGLSVGEVIVG